MAALGARALAPDKGGVEAADTLIIRNTGEGSIVASAAIAISAGLTKALTMFARWGGFGDNNKIRFEINRDFVPFMIDPQMLTSWLAAVQAGQMSPETLFNLMKRGDLIAPEVTFDQEQARIETNPDMPEPVKPEPKKAEAEVE